MHPWFKAIVEEMKCEPMFHQAPPVLLRYMTPGDAQACAAIEAAACRDPWSRQGLRARLGGHRVTGRVAIDSRGETVGYALAAHRHDGIHLVRIAVHPGHRRRGIARLLLDDITAKLGEGRPCASAMVPDTLLDLHLTLRACGWRAMEVVPARDCDLYRFARWIDPPTVHP